MGTGPYRADHTGVGCVSGTPVPAYTKFCGCAAFKNVRKTLNEEPRHEFDHNIGCFRSDHDVQWNFSEKEFFHCCTGHIECEPAPGHGHTGDQRVSFFPGGYPQHALFRRIRSFIQLPLPLPSTLVYFLLNGRDITSIGNNPGEYFALIFFVLCGISIATSFNSLLMLFIGIEIISIPLYILTGSDKRNLKSNEASLKYFLMGAFSTGIMLLGIALLYGAGDKGSFFLDDLALGRTAGSPMMMTGLILLMVSMAFKVSAAPFHFWTPDVYDGAPTVITSFMATIVKAGAFIAFIRLFNDAFGDSETLLASTGCHHHGCHAVHREYHGGIPAKRQTHAGLFQYCPGRVYAVFPDDPQYLAKEGIILYTAVYSRFHHRTVCHPGPDEGFQF